MRTMRPFAALTLGLGLILAVILLASPGHAAPPAVGPMALTSPLVAPSPNMHTAPATSTVSVTYSEAVSPSSVFTQTFAIHAMQTGQLTETYGVNGATVSLTSSRPFHAGELVQTSATTGILSLIDGQGPVSPTVWQFRTAAPYGTARFVDSGQSLGSGAADVALGDLDSDGHLDAFIANGNGFYIPESVWLNDGTGVFSQTQYLGNYDSRAVALGDLDGDGDLDAFVGHGRTNQSNLVYVNDGTGSFTIGWVQPSNLAVSADVALGDMDGDGDLDAMVMNGGGFDDAIWFNDGTGNFPVRSALAGTGNRGDAVALGDLDGDGDLDALVGTWFGSTGVGIYPWRNDGSGTLTQGTHLGTAYTLDVALGDLDSDSDLDVYLAIGLDGQGDGRNEVWVNDGTGVFTDTGQTLGTLNSRAVALGDLDADGDLDAYVVNSDSSNNQNRVWLNTGTGVFMDSGQLLGATESNAVDLGDVDGDGDLDALEANHTTAPDNRVRLNMNLADLGITKAVTPTVVAPGGRITFTLTYSNAGPQAAMGVLIEDVVPVSVTNPSASSAGATITPTGSVSYTWEVADLAPGAGGVITITGVLSADLPLGTAITNTVTITAPVVDGNPGNESGEVAARVPYCVATPDDGTTVYMSVDAQALRDAVAAAGSGGTVKVAGTCAGAAWEAGHDQVVYIHDKDLTVRGGYAPGNWSVSDPDTYPTTLDALDVPNHRVVYVYKNAVTLENLILTNGYFNVLVDTGGGGGIYSDLSTLTVSNTVVINNHGRVGGGIFIYQGSVTLVDSQVVSNTTSGSNTGGGGVFVYQGGASLIVTGDSLIAYNDTGSNGDGGGVWCYSGDAMLYGGEIRDNYARYGGGVHVRNTAASFTQTGGGVGYNSTALFGHGGGLWVYDGAAYLYGGQVIGNQTLGDGGGLHVSSQWASLTVSGTVILSNTAAGRGGGVYNSGASVELNAGEIVSNTSGLNGGGVYVNDANAVFTQTGGVIAYNEANGSGSDDGGGGLYVAQGTAALEGGEVTENSAANRGGGVFVDSGTLTQTSPAAINHNTASMGAGVQVNGGTVTMSGGQVCDNNASNVGGGIHVASGSVAVSGGQICRNDGWSGGGIYLHNGSATLSGGEIISNTAVGSGGGVFVNTSTASFTQSDTGAIAHNTANGASSDAGGGGLFLNWGDAVLSGGLIDDNDAIRGGGVFVKAGDADLALNGTQVSDNRASLYGGGVFVYQGAATLSAGQVVSNSADALGGGVYAGSGGVTLSGADVVSNIAGLNGGGVYALNGDVTMNSGQVADNTANGTNPDGNGGGLYLDSGSLTLSGGKIIGNTALRSGGGLFFAGTSLSQTVANVIAHNNAESSGGGIFLDSGNATLSGEVVSNTAGTNGAGVYVQTAAASLKGQIGNNVADQQGGGVYVGEQAHVLLDGGEAISNAAESGGGVYVSLATAVFTQTGGTIQGNRAGSDGGGVYVLYGSAVLSGTRVADNTAEAGGGVYVHDEATVTLTATHVTSNVASGLGGGMVVEGGTSRVVGGAITSNDTGIHVMGDGVGGSLLVQSAVISDNQTAGLVYASGTTSVTVTLGGAPGAANTFRDNGPGGTVNITVTASSDRPLVSALFNDWGVTGLASIEATLHHQFDDNSLAWVRYYTLALAADPPVQWADGVSPIVLTATVGGLLGPVPGDVISFTTTLGDLSAPAEATDAGHQARVDLTSLVTGTAYVTATAGVDAFHTHPVTVSVEFAYAAPTANGDSYETPEDTTLAVPTPGVLANDNDPGIGALAVTLDVEPVTGGLDLRADGAFTYTPPLNYNGLITFTYVADNGRLTDTATVSITVTSVNDLPTISDIPDQVTTAGTPVGPILFTIGDVETDPDALLLDSDWDDLVLVTPGNAVFGGSGITRTLTITPTSGETGVTTFTISLDDGEDVASDTFVLTVIEHRIYLPLVLRDF